ncbi:hypothetical protein EYF80_021085 [Liparis tanakae]|uniref:Uncharacterized protein n=1 Tax=Liparis tanakae TaxID=230148 RepID=A0A4Z2HS61_9TELE|nr:hypothetical protein EYF80_021085 [Liparis tanakae]
MVTLRLHYEQKDTMSRLRPLSMARVTFRLLTVGLTVPASEWGSDVLCCGDKRYGQWRQGRPCTGPYPSPSYRHFMGWTGDGISRSGVGQIVEVVSCSQTLSENVAAVGVKQVEFIVNGRGYLVHAEGIQVGLVFAHKADTNVAQIRDIKLPVRTHRQRRGCIQFSILGVAFISEITITVGLILAVTATRCTCNQGDLSIGGHLSYSVYFLFVRLSYVQNAIVGHGQGVGRLKGGMDGHFAHEEMRASSYGRHWSPVPATSSRFLATSFTTFMDFTLKTFLLLVSESYLSSRTLVTFPVSHGGQQLVPVSEAITAGAGDAAPAPVAHHATDDRRLLGDEDVLPVAHEPAKAVRGAGDTTGPGRVKLLRSQLGMSFSSCRMTMVSMTKKRPHGNQRVCSWVMNGARSKCRAMAMPPLVTKSKLEHRGADEVHPVIEGLQVALGRGHLCLLDDVQGVRGADAQRGGVTGCLQTAVWIHAVHQAI